MQIVQTLTSAFFLSLAACCGKRNGQFSRIAGRHSGNPKCSKKTGEIFTAVCYAARSFQAAHQLHPGALRRCSHSSSSAEGRVRGLDRSINVSWKLRRNPGNKRCAAALEGTEMENGKVLLAIPCACPRICCHLARKGLVVDAVARNRCRLHAMQAWPKPFPAPQNLLREV